MTIDTSGFEQLLSLPISTALWRLFFWYFGWLPVAIVIFWGVIQLWLQTRQEYWGSKQKFILLAIDVPRNNAQSPRAVENMFIYFAGAHSTISLIDKWWYGKYQLSFSLEIVSIDGFIQFLIHTPEASRNLVETAIYSQYPDAEIYEVEDYTTIAPNRYPNDEYDIWGSEFILVKDPVLPIRTYPEFEHKMGELEVQWKDPMASLMDLMSSLQRGEQLWYQIILVPILGAEWPKKRDAFVSKMLGEKQKPTGANNFIDSLLKWMGVLSEQIYSIWGDIEDKKKESDPLKMMNLKPVQKAQIEAADMKMSKLLFEVSIRGLYFSRTEVMNKPKVVQGFIGYIKQFNTGDLNAIKPDTKITMTSAVYMFAKQRIREKKNKLMYAYKLRSAHLGRKPWIMNVEELATLWHFPIDAVVKAPLIQRASARRVEPPMSLPFGSELKKTKVLREPIFDETFETEDDNAIRDQVEADDVVKAPKVPGFMDDPSFAPYDGTTADMPTSAPDEDSEGREKDKKVVVVEPDEPFYTKTETNVPLESYSKETTKPVSPNREEATFAPAELRRDKPPANLPFVD